MATFVECFVPSIIYRRGEAVINHAVNIDLCTKIRKTIKLVPGQRERLAVD